MLSRASVVNRLTNGAGKIKIFSISCKKSKKSVFSLSGFLSSYLL